MAKQRGRYGITGLPTDPRVAAGLPTQLITGYSDLGRQATNPQWQYPTVFNPKVNYTWLQGRHSLKTGYEFQRVLTEVQDVNPLYGRDSYPGSSPAGRRHGGNLYNLADFMLGLRSTYALSNILVAELQQNMHFLYLQDDSRINDRLTRTRACATNTSMPWKKEQRAVELQSHDHDDGGGAGRVAPGPLDAEPDRNNFGPRLGMAYMVLPIGR